MKAEFGLSRSELLDVLADVMLVSDSGRSAFLGRFQHLQRLSLVDGINPGRGKAAQYRADQVVVIAIAMQFLQIGLSPERIVTMMHSQYWDIDQSIKLALAYTPEARLERSYIFVDPGQLFRLSKPENGDGEDLFFGAWGQEEFEKQIRRLTVSPSVSRLAIINVSTTIELIAHTLEGGSILSANLLEKFPLPGPKHEAFMDALNNWLHSERRQEELKRRRLGNP